MKEANQQVTIFMQLVSNGNQQIQQQAISKKVIRHCDCNRYTYKEKADV
jgi:hypothetical protein